MGTRRGLHVDDFAPRLSFFFNAHNDFFEEIAKYRGRPQDLERCDDKNVSAREIRARLDALPYPDRGRFADRAAAKEQHRARRYPGPGRGAGGTQSLHTDGFDEALASPTEDAARIALRTQQILATNAVSRKRSTRWAGPISRRH